APWSSIGPAWSGLDGFFDVDVELTPDQLPPRRKRCTHFPTVRELMPNSSAVSAYVQCSSSIRDTKRNRETGRGLRFTMKLHPGLHSELNGVESPLFQGAPDEQRI